MEVNWDQLSFNLHVLHVLLCCVSCYVDIDYIFTNLQWVSQSYVDTCTIFCRHITFHFMLSYRIFDSNFRQVAACQPPPVTNVLLTGSLNVYIEMVPSITRMECSALRRGLVASFPISDNTWRKKSNSNSITNKCKTMFVSTIGRCISVLEVCKV